MTAVVDLWNQSLSHLGMSVTVQSETEASVQARVLGRFYATCRDYVLRDFPWPCANMVVALAEEANTTFIGWDKVYAYPAHCLAIRQICDESGARILSRSIFTQWSEQEFLLPKIPFTLAVKDDESKTLVLTDLDPAYAMCTRALTNAALFDKGLFDSIAWRLAALAGPALQVEKDYIGNAWNQYNACSITNKANALNESQQDREADSPSISIR